MKLMFGSTLYLAYFYTHCMLLYTYSCLASYVTYMLVGAI